MSTMTIRISNWHRHSLAGIVTGGLQYETRRYLPFLFLHTCIILLLLGWTHIYICPHSNTVLCYSHYYSVVSFKNLFQIIAKHSPIIVWLPQTLYRFADSDEYSLPRPTHLPCSIAKWNKSGGVVWMNETHSLKRLALPSLIGKDRASVAVGFYKTRLIRFVKNKW